MAVEPRAPVSVIEGIGPAAAAALARLGIHSVFDLLRARVELIHQGVTSLASLEEVRSWRSMASLLEVAAVTPQWAEALVRGGIGAVDELSRKRLDEVDALLQAARDEGVVPDTPTATQIAEMLKDAAVIACSGVLTGTALSVELNPVADASVRIGVSRATTDDRGRFRIPRIPLGRMLPLRVEHSEYKPLLVENPAIAIDSGLIDVQVFKLERRLAGEPGPTPVALSELNGDALPVPRGQPVRPIRVDVDDLRPGDVLRVHQLYASAPDVELVSRLKTYENGEFLVRTVRVPLSTLPAGVQLGDHFLFTGSEFVRGDATSITLHRYKIRLRAQKAFATRSQPVTPEEKRAYFTEWYRYLLNQGYFAPRLRPRQ